MSDNCYLNDPQAGMSLIANLIAQPSETERELAVALGHLEKLLKDDFLMLCSMDNMPAQAQVFTRLQAAYNHLEDIALFSGLINRNVVAVGGGFSTGKSRFLNSLIKDNILPTDVTPTTAIPTYIMGAQEEKINAINTFNLKVPLDREALKAISHEFKQHYNVSFSHIIKVLTIEKSAFPYPNIAFLDTPGYDKYDSLIKGSMTDEQIAHDFLSRADYIIWLVDATNGTITETDLRFMQSLDCQNPIFVIFSQADLIAPEAVDTMVEDARLTLHEIGIACAGVVGYSSSMPGITPDGAEGIHSYLSSINNRARYTTITKEFERLFEACLQYNQNEMVQAKDTLAILNRLNLEDNTTAKQQTELKPLINNYQQLVKHHKMSIHGYQSLFSRFEEAINEVLGYLELPPEDPQERGIVGLGMVQDDKVLANLQIETSLSATVTKISAFGVTLDCGLGGAVFISIVDIKKRLSNPVEDIFTVGKRVEVEIVDINRLKREIKIITRI